MSQACYYHPAVGAASTCIQCGIPLCSGCTRQIGNSTACKQCGPAVQTRFQNSPAANSYSAPRMPESLQAPYGSLQAPYGSPAAGAAAYQAPVEESGSVPLGLLLGSVIGVVGSIVVLKILFYAHFGLSMLYIGVGYGIGYGIWSQTRRGSVWLALSAVGIMIASLCIAHLVFAGDVLNAARASGDADAGTTLLDAIPVSMHAFSPMHWVCILIGLAACWRGVEQQSS